MKNKIFNNVTYSVTSDDFLVYRLLTATATFFWIFVLICDTVDVENSNGYDLTNSILNFDIMLPPSLCFFIHCTIETFFIKLYKNSIFLIFASLVSIITLIYEVIFCLLNLNFLVEGYYAWIICCFLFTFSVIIYLSNIIKIKSRL